jgi:predicted nucleotidyltransferase
MSLDQVINALVENPRVECCFLLGSTATGIARWSDYDVLVVGDVPEPFAVEFRGVVRSAKATDVIQVVSGNSLPTRTQLKTSAASYPRL